MKLVTLKPSSPANRQGDLAVVSSDNRTAVRVPEIAPTLLSALEQWSTLRPKLQEVADKLNAGSAMPGAFDLKFEDTLAPLPFAPGFYDEGGVWV